MATDQEIREAGYYYIPPQEYLKDPFKIPAAPEAPDNVNTGGIVNTDAFNDSNNILAGYDDKIGAPGASPFLNMSQLNYSIGNPDTIIAPGVRLGGAYLPPGTADFNKQLFETGPYADPYGKTLADYKRNPMLDPLNQKIVEKLRADMDAAYPSEGTADLIAKYREYNPDYNRYTDEEITQLGLKGFKPNYTDEELIDMYGNQNFQDEEDEKFNLMDYIPFVGNKSMFQGIMSAVLPKQDSRVTNIKDYYGGSDNLDSIGRIQSGLMAGYSPVHGGFLNTITGGRYGSPTSYGLQRAYQKRIDTINKTEKRKGGLSKELKERREQLKAEKAAELKALQTAQAQKNYETIQDAYDTQTGPGSSYSGGDDTKEGRSTDNYHDPFDPGHAD